MADQIIAMRIQLEDEGLITNTAAYIREAARPGAARNNQAAIQRYSELIEADLARLYQMTSGGPEERGVPDLLMSSAQMARAMELVMEQPGMFRKLALRVGFRGRFPASEVKAKQKLGGSKGGTTVGQFNPFSATAAPALTEAIKAQALEQEEEVPDGLNINDPAAVLRAARAKFGSKGARGFFDMIKKNDPDMHMTFYHKVKNLTITKGIADSKGKIVGVDAFQIHFPLSKYTSPPFTTELSGKAIVYVLEKAFERDLIENLRNEAPAILAKNAEEFQKGLAKISKKQVVSKEKLMSGVTVGYGMIFGIPTGGSIPRLRAQLKKGVAPKRQPRRQTRGQFISNVQLSAILQQQLTQDQPRYPEPTPPTPRYVTGRLARSFMIMVNYRKNLISYYNTPPAAGYVDQLNQGGWQLDRGLVEPTIRQMTQSLFGRQFQVIRTQ